MYVKGPLQEKCIENHEMLSCRIQVVRSNPCLLVHKRMSIYNLKSLSTTFKASTNVSFDTGLLILQ